MQAEPRLPLTCVCFRVHPFLFFRTAEYHVFVTAANRTHIDMTFLIRYEVRNRIQNLWHKVTGHLNISGVSNKPVGQLSDCYCQLLQVTCISACVSLISGQITVRLSEFIKLNVVMLITIYLAHSRLRAGN